MAEVDEPDLRQAQNAAAKASLAGIGSAPFGLRANSHELKRQQAEERQSRILEAFSKVLFPALLLIPLAVVLVVGYALWRERVLGRSLAVGIGLPLLVICWFAAVLFLVPLPGAPWADTPLDKLGYLIDELGPALLCLVAPLILGGLAGALAWLCAPFARANGRLVFALLMLTGLCLSAASIPRRSCRQQCRRTRPSGHHRLCGRLPGPAAGLCRTSCRLWLQTPGLGAGWLLPLSPSWPCS